MILALLLAACAAESPPATPPTPAPAAPAPAAPAADPTLPVGTTTDGGATVTAPTLLGEAPGVNFLGTWTSPSCGGRAYARNMYFEADNGFAGIDLVSPCPKGTTCIWSGMSGFAGIWKQEGTKLLLREMGAPIEAGGPHPTTFEATADGQLVENGCFYTRGLTVPTGYTESEVTPRIPGMPKPAADAPAADPPAAPAKTDAPSKKDAPPTPGL